MKQNKFFPEINGNFGFGCMRLPTKDRTVDVEEFKKMADAFLDAGFNYFDTAHGYHRGASETAIREAVAKRYDRSRFILTDKLTDPYFKKQEDIRPFFEKQLEWCGVDYFDFYLMHAQDKENYKKFKECRAYETAYSLKEEGLIRHFGISFHDKAEVLDMILTEHPEIDIVQIQFNYIDYDDASVESAKVYGVCEKHNKPVIVMEPVKGGSLVRLPKAADEVLRALGGAYSNAGYAIRYAASYPNMAMIISGMSNMAQVNDNVSTMKDFSPLSEKEFAAIEKVREVFRSQNLVPCTGCRYCVDENTCPMDILIPDMFSSLNSHEAFHNWNTGFYYETVLTVGHGKASECLGCGMCESVCPQHLPIRELLGKVAETFEK